MDVVLVKKHPGQQARDFDIGGASPNNRVAPELFPDSVPGFAIDDRLMLAGITFALMDDVADIDRVRYPSWYITCVPTAKTVRPALLRISVPIVGTV